MYVLLLSFLPQFYFKKVNFILLMLLLHDIHCDMCKKDHISDLVSMKEHFSPTDVVVKVHNAKHVEKYWFKQPWLVIKM